MPQDPPQSDRAQARRRVVGERIRAARVAANLTQEQLCEAADVSRRQLYRIEYGIADSTLTVLYGIADALRVPLSDLVADDLSPIARRLPPT